MPSSQSGLAVALAELRASAAHEGRIRDLLIDFVAAVLVGAGTSLGKAIFTRYVQEGASGLAFAFAYLAEISEYSHGSNRSAGHLGSTPLPVVLGYAADPAFRDIDWNGAALCGYEAFSRTGQCLMPALEQWGAYSTGFSGAIGAAAAAARISGLSVEGICSALGIAGYITPFSAMDAYLSGANSAEAAAATSIGIHAAELARMGVKGSETLLDDLHSRIVGAAAPPGFARAGDATLGIDHVYWKPYPCCRFTHGAIQAVLELPTDIRGESIAHIEVITTERAVRICGGLRRKGPLSYLDRQFSLPYLVALAAIDREINLRRIMGPPSAADDIYSEFAALRVAVKADAKIALHGNICPTIIRIRLTDGNSLESEVLKPWGCPEAPLTSADIQQKFRQAARETNVEARAADALLEAACALNWDDVARRLLDCLVSPVSETVQ